MVQRENRRGVNITNITAAAAGLLLFAGLAHGGGQGGVGGQNGSYDPAAFNALHLDAIIRDFKPASQSGGHPDFGIFPDGGMGHYMGNIADTLDADGKPVFQGGGALVLSSWMNAKGLPIHPSVYDASAGDAMGALAATTDDGAITSVNSFRQWFRDVPNMNISARMPITLEKNEATGRFVFDDRVDSHMADIFPGGNKNRHYTFEVEMKFRYSKGSKDFLAFAGDDDMWVFIDGRLVADIGGVHSVTGQVVELDRLDWLVDGEEYDMKVFFAERNNLTSRLRIESTVVLLPGELPGVYGQYD